MTIYFLELLIGLAQNITVMEGSNATLCVNFNSEFATNFSINVGHLLTSQTLDNPGMNIHMRIFLEWTQWNASIK